MLDGYKHFRKNKQGRQEGNKVVLAIQENLNCTGRCFLFVLAGWANRRGALLHLLLVKKRETG